MSWIIRLYNEQGEIEAEQSGYLHRTLAVNAVPYMLQSHNIDGYDRDEYTLNLNNGGCMDCMDTERDVQYLLTVFEQGKEDPYDRLTRELAAAQRRLQRFHQSPSEPEPLQKRQHDEPRCTCELIF